MTKKWWCVLAVFLVIFKINGQAQIVGNVTDLEAGPLSNVSIHLLNTNINTLSDKNGNFSIKEVAAGKYTIELSSIGFATIAKSIEVNAKDNKPFNFQMKNSLELRSNKGYKARIVCHRPGLFSSRCLY